MISGLDYLIKGAAALSLSLSMATTQLRLLISKATEI
jgi:hypothetical protein